MTEYIECTLQEAVEKCDRFGGRFRHPHGDIWYICDETSVYTEHNNTPFELDIVDFRNKWIYEPPEKSPFQEWNLKTPTTGERHHQHIQKEGRKEGWKAHHEAVEKLKCDKTASGRFFFIPVDEFDKLKEP
jgi:hypothetical protein